MKLALVYIKFAVSVAAFVGYLVFAFSVNEVLTPHLDGLQRGLLVSLSIVGAGFVIVRASEYLSTKLFAQEIVE